MPRLLCSGLYTCMLDSEECNSVKKCVWMFVGMSDQDVINLSIKVTRLLNLTMVSHYPGNVSYPISSPHSTHLLAKLENRLPSNMSFFRVVFNLDIDNVDRPVELAPASEKVWCQIVRGRRGMSLRAVLLTLANCIITTFFARNDHVSQDGPLLLPSLWRLLDLTVAIQHR